MLKWIRDKYDDWKFEKEFQAKKKEIMKENYQKGYAIIKIVKDLN